MPALNLDFRFLNPVAYDVTRIGYRMAARVLAGYRRTEFRLGLDQGQCSFHALLHQHRVCRALSGNVVQCFFVRRERSRRPLKRLFCAYRHDAR